MRPTAVIFSLLTVALLALTFWLFRLSAPADLELAAGMDVPAAETGAKAGLVTAQLVLVDGHRREGPSVIRLRQGETLHLQITTNRDGELHLHGYDRSVHLVAGESVDFELQAKFNGRFEYELHGDRNGAHEPLGVIEVLPR